MKNGLFHSVMDLVFPPRCVFCRRFLKAGENGICRKCADGLPYADDAPKRKGNFFEKCVSPLYYEGNVRRSILSFKFGGRFGYARAYAPLLAECIEKNFKNEYDLITWIPLSGKRMKKRGYDQSFLLASEAAKLMDDVVVETLKKTGDTPAQSKMRSADERRANVMGVYEVVEPELVKGQRILLIDDIITTGSTLSEGAKMLMMAGAQYVMCATLARTR